MTHGVLLDLNIKVRQNANLVVKRQAVYPALPPPPTGGSPAQAHHRLKRTTWQLARTRAAETVRK